MRLGTILLAIRILKFKMALTEQTKIDRMEILEDGQIQVRKARVILDNGVEISRTFHREVLDPGRQPADLNTRDARIQAVAEAVWTPEVVSEREAKLETERQRDAVAPTER
jgi:hypothetical protein